MLVIITTAAVTILAFGKIKPFQNANNRATYALLCGLILELTGAYVQVIRGLPKLEYNHSKTFELTISYGDLTKYFDNDSNSCAKIFAGHGGIEALLACRDVIERYRTIQSFSARNGATHQQDAALWQRTLKTDQATQCLTKEMLEMNESDMEHCSIQVEHFERLQQSSQGVGRGKMYLTQDGERLRGVALYYFPNDTQTTVVIDMGGEQLAKPAVGGSEYLQLQFAQAQAVSRIHGRFVIRDSANYSVCFHKISKYTYEGDLFVDDVASLGCPPNDSGTKPPVLGRARLTLE